MFLPETEFHIGREKEGEREGEREGGREGEGERGEGGKEGMTVISKLKIIRGGCTQAD